MELIYRDPLFHLVFLWALMYLLGDGRLSRA
jgi:hypothetical protein